MAKSQIEFPTQVDLEEKISDWAHDLRSPFNHVIGFTKLMLKEQSGPLTDLQKEDLTTVYRSSLRAMSLVNNLIEIARLQRGEKDVKRAPWNYKPPLTNPLRSGKRTTPGWRYPLLYS